MEGLYYLSSGCFRPRTRIAKRSEGQPCSCLSYASLFLIAAHFVFILSRSGFCCCIQLKADSESNIASLQKEVSNGKQITGSCACLSLATSSLVRSLSSAQPQSPASAVLAAAADTKSLPDTLALEKAYLSALKANKVLMQSTHVKEVRSRQWLAYVHTSADVLGPATANTAEAGGCPCRAQPTPRRAGGVRRGLVRAVSRAGRTRRAA